MPVGEMPPSVQKLRSSAAITASLRTLGIWFDWSSWRLVPALKVPIGVLPSAK